MADTDPIKDAAVKAAKDAADTGVPGADAQPSSPSPAGGLQQKGAVQITAPEEAYQHDETVEGGLYAVRAGKATQTVNAHGKRVNDQGGRVRADGTKMTAQEVLAERLEISASEMEALAASEVK